jgi:SAM-dependent methyltransferase
MRVADYGGTAKIGGNLVKGMLERGGMKDYTMLDYDSGVDLLKPIEGEKFDLGICMDLLEHTTNPFIVAKNIKDSLREGAYLFVTVPWVWELHSYPGDYWRFTIDGVKELFTGMEVIEEGYLRDKHTDPEPLPRERVIVIFKKK